MRLEKINSIRDKLKTGKISIGTWQQIPHASVSEILGQSGFDWIAVDMEHGSISLSQLPDLFRAIELGGSLPLVRISEPSQNECKQFLDAGSGGVIVPMIKNAEQLKSIRDSCRWPPAGTRGVGFSRANLFGKNFDDYFKESQSPLLIAQIEHITAVENLDKILQVNGLDAIIVGPYDLSASMGITGEFDSSDFIKVMNNITNLCKKYNVPSGDHIVQPDLNLMRKRIDQGCTFLAYSIDSVFLQQSSKILDI